jgi:formylglycine-generating enzyme required for sulfatase activity
MGQYNKIGSKRKSSGAWQWTIIGFFPGLLCGGLLIFALSLTGVLAGLAPAPTPIYITEVVQIREIITTTPEPPIIITATPQPTNTPGESVIVVASPTPTVDLALAATSTAQSQSAQASTAATITPAAGEAQAIPTQQTSNVPAQLAEIAHPLVTIPGGVFEMGTTNQEIIEAAQLCLTQGGQCDPVDGVDSTPLVRVEIETFRMEQYEVTFEQYVRFLNYLNSQGQRHTSGCSGFLCVQTANENPETAAITFDSANYNVPAGLLNHPVYGVTWYGAEAYCRTVGLRLPTEAEWEYAARAGDERLFAWGNDWIEANANTRLPVDGPQGTVAVTEYGLAQNPYGLYNITGNVAEWVADWYDPNYYSTLAGQGQPVFDPQGPVAGTQKVLRGGSWNTFPFYARTVHRQALLPVPDRPNDNYPRWMGFRCAADANPDAATTSSGVNPATLGIGTPQSDSAAPALPTSVEAAATQESSSRG